MRIALLGGSFNPLHIGHAMLAETVVTEFGYDLVLFVPAFIPPHKEMNGAVSAEDRLNMIKTFCCDEKRFIAEDCEVIRGGISYTYDTLTYIIEKYKDRIDGKPAFIMGQENAGEFDKWFHAKEIAQVADLIIAHRHPDNNNIDTCTFCNKPSGAYTGAFVSDDTNFQYPHLMLANPLLPVSSSEIRARIAQKKSWRYLVPGPVFEYIISHQLYGYKNY